MSNQNLGRALRGALLLALALTPVHAHAHGAGKKHAAAPAAAASPAPAAATTPVEGTVVVLKHNLLGQTTHVGIKDAANKTYEVTHGPNVPKLIKLVGKKVKVNGVVTEAKGKAQLDVKEIAG